MTERQAEELIRAVHGIGWTLVAIYAVLLIQTCAGVVK